MKIRKECLECQNISDDSSLCPIVAKSDLSSQSKTFTIHQCRAACVSLQGIIEQLNRSNENMK